MKKELIKTYRIYQNIDNTFKQITIQLEGYGHKTIFNTEEEALEGLKCNIKEEYKNGNFSILPVYDIRYVN